VLLHKAKEEGGLATRAIAHMLGEEGVSVEEPSQDAKSA
jgi:hypothetical protein